jgi:hypothetical protein
VALSIIESVGFAIAGSVGFAIESVGLAIESVDLTAIESVGFFSITGAGVAAGAQAASKIARTAIPGKKRLINMFSSKVSV